MNSNYKLPAGMRKEYFGFKEFMKKFPNEKACEEELLKIKYPDGYKCKSCKHEVYHRLKSTLPKRSRLIICSKCKTQESLTSGTIFQYTKQPLHNWFIAIFLVTQTKKGISSYLLSKHLNVTHSTGFLMLHKIRHEMTEDAITYQIGGENAIVEADEIEIGGENSIKQEVLVLLEKENGKLHRVRFAAIADKKFETIEKNIICQVKKGTTLHTDGKKGNLKLSIRNRKRISKVIQVSHREENYTYEFLKDLDTIVSNLKTWYKGIHHHISSRNISYYLNEFAYRFNRRRSEVNIFDKLLKRSIIRAAIITQRKFFDQGQYLPLSH
jgi:transposase-like protein